MKRAKKQGLVSNNEEAFILSGLDSAEIRTDGRCPTDYRNVEISYFQQQGHVCVSIGKTKVISCVTCEAVEPFPERPNEGFLMFNVDLSPMGSEHFEGKRSEQSIEMARIIDRALRGSKAIDTEALCIVARKIVWSVRVDLTVIDNFGNLVDCAHLAAITSLLHFKRPEVTIEGQEYKIHSTSERNAVSLSIHHIPICVSFVFFEGDHWVVDPNQAETLISSGMMTVAMNSHGEICGVQKGGGIPVEISDIIDCTKLAKEKTIEITKILKESLSKDESERKLKATPEYAKKKPIVTVVEDDIDEDSDIDISDEEIEEEESEIAPIPVSTKKMFQKEVAWITKEMKDQTIKKSIIPKSDEIEKPKVVEKVIEKVVEKKVVKPVAKPKSNRSNEPLDLSVAIKKK